MLKKWSEMAKVDVSAYVEKRADEKGKEFDYIPWAAMLELLYANGAEEVKYGITPSEKGHSVHMTETGFTDKNGAVTHCPEVWVWVEIDGKHYDYAYPVISGSYVVKDMTLNQQRIHTAIARAQCKCVAINTGLAISLWSKADETDVKADIDIVELQSAELLFSKLGTQVSELMREYGMAESEIAAQMGLDTERVGDVIRVDIKRLMGYEKALKKIKLEKANGK